MIKFNNVDRELLHHCDVDTNLQHATNCCQMKRFEAMLFKPLHTCEQIYDSWDVTKYAQ